MRQLTFILALLIATPAFAQEPVGCDKFKWPLDKERTMLASPASVDGDINSPLDKAYRLALRPVDEIKLPQPPTRAPKSGTNAGLVTAAAPPKAGSYRFTLSEPGWIDVLQNGRAIKSGAFSSATGCAGIRKSVKFDLSVAPFTVEITGVPTTSISFVVTPD